MSEVAGAYGGGNKVLTILVLFILLVIVAKTWGC
ncbi:MULTISPECIES: sporulation protein YjcZ [Paenibacillus]|nr:MULTISPECIES: sporulation protein YjcZ [Paenibacillus]MDR9857184.1 sporulation protein YjcZ [Paenibacillus sp. VCA1]